MSSHSLGSQPPSAGPLSGEPGMAGRGGGAGAAGDRSSLEAVKWIFQTPAPPPHSICLFNPRWLSQSRPSSAKCDLAPLIAGGAGGAMHAGGREDPSQALQQPAGVADEGGKGLTLPLTHTHIPRTDTHTMVGASGLPGQAVGPGNGLGPLCAGAPIGLSAVTVTTTRLPPVGPPPLSNQAQARWPGPGSAYPTPLGCSGRPGSVCTSLSQ